MLRKLLVAVLACITLFLSQRALTERGGRPAPQLRSDGPQGGDAKATRTAVLF